jgi:hypothetical protein
MFDWIKGLLLNRYVASGIAAAVVYISNFAKELGVPLDVIQDFQTSSNVVLAAIAAYAVKKGFELVSKKK